MDLSGVSAVVTGGAGGFGAATTRRLVAAGAKVVIADLADDTGKELVEELGEEVTRFVRTDVTDEDSVAEAVAAASELGPLRVAVIVHGGQAIGARLINRQGEAYPLSAFRRTVDV